MRESELPVARVILEDSVEGGESARQRMEEACAWKRNVSENDEAVLGASLLGGSGDPDGSAGLGSLLLKKSEGIEATTPCKTRS
jgi:hypothetical protein